MVLRSSLDSKVWRFKLAQLHETAAGPRNQVRPDLLRSGIVAVPVRPNEPSYNITTSCVLAHSVISHIYFSAK